MLPPILIDSDEALRRLVSALAGEPAIAMDTESNSLFAYRERLCLVQISAAGVDYLVDPLTGIDLGVLAPILADPGIVKVFHDAEFDVLMLKRAHAFEIAGIFDTKVAACSLGFEAIGLAPILARCYGVQLDKKLQRSDWGRRPLSDAQLDYARSDTHWLLDLAHELRQRLHVAGEIHALEVAAECRRLEALVPEPRRIDPLAWARLAGIERLDSRGRAALRALFQMRERIASERDLPPFKVLGNDVLVALARSKARTQEALSQLEGVPARLVERHAVPILAALQEADAGPPVDRISRSQCENGQGGLSAEQTRVFEALRAWRKQVASERRVDASLILARPTMLGLARLRPRPRILEDLLASGLLEPWRVERYGAGILAACGR